MIATECESRKRTTFVAGSLVVVKRGSMSHREKNIHNNLVLNHPEDESSGGGTRNDLCRTIYENIYLIYVKRESKYGRPHP